MALKTRSAYFKNSFVGVCCEGFLTCTMAPMSMGSMDRGNRRMLKREMAVKAFPGVKMLSGLTFTNTANVTRETWEKQHREKQITGLNWPCLFRY